MGKLVPGRESNTWRSPSSGGCLLRSSKEDSAVKTEGAVTSNLSERPLLKRQGVTRLVRTRRKRNTHALLVEMEIGAATMENALLVLQIVKYRITMWPIDSTQIPKRIENTHTQNLPCSQQHYSQQPKSGDSSDIPRLINR